MAGGRTRSRRLVVAALLAAAGPAACASRPPSADASSARPARLDRTVLTRELMLKNRFTTVYDAVAALRSMWLRPRGPESFSLPMEVLVYLDNTILGSVETLRNVQPSLVSTVRFYDGPQATARWGVGHSAGVIHVSTWSNGALGVPSTTRTPPDTGKTRSDTTTLTSHAYEPTPRSDANSMLAHEQLLAKRTQGKIDVYYIGDSITRRWGATDYPDLLANWRQNFFGWNAADFGWGADRVENILWRVDHGELDGVHPKVIVLLAGTNNLPGPGSENDKVADITRGLRALVDRFRQKAPDATVILTGIFPRAGSAEMARTITRINANLARMADGWTIRYLNARLGDANGQPLPGVTGDGLHPTLAGYQIWADALKPVLTELLGPPATTDAAPPPTGDPSAKKPAGQATSLQLSLQLPKLFADGMVVQRGAAIPVWGWATAGSPVAVTFRGATARTVADTSGAWRVTFPATTAGGPFAFTVAGPRDTLRVRDVLVGDVWVASGQSNMEWPLSMTDSAKATIAAAHDSALRHFKVPVAWAERPARDLTGGAWVPADPQHAGDFSGVAYFFARELRERERVPIGVVNATWGGSAIETWLSAESQSLGSDGPARALGAERARLDSTRDALRARLGGVAERDPGMANGKAAWAEPVLDERAWKPIKVPGYWEGQGYDGLDGVAWYRTEFALTSEEAARGLTLALGPIDDDDVTWVNGVEVGRTSGYLVPRRYKLPAYALHSGTNVLAVRVSDYSGGGGIASPDLPPVRLELAGATRELTEWKFRVGEIGGQLDGQRVNKVPAITYNAMIAPLLPMPIKGVLWYQGESNANNDAQARKYRGQFARLINSWRDAFGGGSAGTFPFLWVQLPRYTRADSVPSASGGGWALQRESMTAALALPNTGQAITIDLGGATDLHPTNKRDPGHRLALVARRVAYGEAVLASGPTYRAHTVANGRVTVSFDNLGKGLAVRGASLGGFAVAGADRRWVWARARVAGDKVVVWSDQVKNPVAVRYAWANNPDTANLINRDGLPAAPFRTDSW